MEKRILGGTGMEVTVLGFGGAEIGYGNAAQQVVDRLLGSALDAGLNTIDTAECYAASEELIGNAVAHRRSSFFLFTKCGHASGFPQPDWDLEMLAQSIDRSLKRLKTDCVDLLQLHTCSEEILRQGDVISVVQKARDAGKARFIGYSGDGAAARYAIECDAFDTLQTSISICDQECLDVNIPLALERHVGVIAKRPIANAVFKYAEKPDNGYIVDYWERLQALDYPFAKREDAASTALRFTLSTPGVNTAIVGTMNPERWAANAAMLEAGSLLPEEYSAIRDRWKAVRQEDWTGRG